MDVSDQQKQFVLALLAYAAQREISIADLCKASNIDLQAVVKKSDYVINSGQRNALWANASSLCNDSLFGLHFGESLQLAALGAVGEIIKSSETVGQALTIAASFTPVVTELFKMDVKKSKKTILVDFSKAIDTNDDFLVTQVADFLLMFTIHELDGFLLKKVKPRSVTFPHVVKSTEYERVLRCKPTKGKHYCLELDASYWDEPIITANYELQKHFLEKINIVYSQRTPEASLKAKIMEYLSRNAYLGLLSLEDVAANFNMTPRSLQRRLQNESITFQQIADSVRKSLALHYMETGKYQLKEISNILGYNELSAFSRAFKRWTGKAPMEYRA